MAIEILENTLLKLLVRRGTDSDRKQITLESGELGYTTDTERLYIGNSNTLGGVIVGNVYKGKKANVTSLAPVVSGDYAFETDTNTLKVCIAGTGANAGDWLTVANQISAGDGDIIINTANKITVGTLSAGNFDSDSLGAALEIDTNDRIALSGTINVDNIIQRTPSTTNYLSLPSKLKIGKHEYDFPGIGPENQEYLGANSSGELSWSAPRVVTSTFAPTTASVIPVATIVPFASAAAEVPYGWLSCNGSEYVSNSYPELSAAIGTAYNTGGETSTDYFRVPSLNNKVVYGHPNPANSTLVGVTTAALSESPVLSATGTHFMIKSIGGVTSPTLTVQKNLTAFVNSVDKTGVAFNPLSGSVVIEKASPGIWYKDDGLDTHTFTMPSGIHYVKFYVTGTGAKGGSSTGGAGATCVGYLSASPGTVFKVAVGAGPTIADAPTNGSASYIYTPDGTTTLVRADGGIYESDNFWQTDRSRWQQPTAVAGGIVLTANDYVLNGLVITGGSGMMDTGTDSGGPNAGREESLGASSYWGSSPAWGGGQGAHSEAAFGAVPGNGIVMLEWN